MGPGERDQGGTADDVRPNAELPTEQAHLAHRLEELFHGIQTTLFAQEMAAQQQLQSIADVWAATDRYRAAGHGQTPEPFPRTPDRLVPPDIEPVGEQGGR